MQDTSIVKETPPKPEMRKYVRCGQEFELKPWERGRAFCTNRCRKPDEHEGH
jgi:endogenous inhibitor of DNA gyrase (YacG/DUF329 family)